MNSIIRKIQSNKFKYLTFNRNKNNLQQVKIKLLILLVLSSFGVQAKEKPTKESSTSQKTLSTVASTSSESRDPASSQEVKKNIVDQGFTPENESPTRLWNSPWRKDLEGKGLEWDAFYFWNGVSNSSGGIKKGAVGFSTFDLIVKMDFEKMMGWTGGNLFVHHHTHGGKNPGEFVGDQNGVNSFSPPDSGDSFLSQLYLRQTWGAEGSLDVLLGLYDFSSEFFVTEDSMIFLNNSFLLGAESYPPANSELSVYPINAPGLRFKWSPQSSFYLMAGASSATARDPHYTNGTHSRMGKDEGDYQIIETGYLPSSDATSPHKLALGYWKFSKQEDVIKDTTKKDTISGLYLLAQYQLNANVGLFGRAGIANDKVAPVNSSQSLGVNFKKVFHSTDKLGFGISQTHLNPESKKIGESLGASLSDSEDVIEIVYTIEPIPGILFTPDFQKITAPSMDKSIKDATVATLRVELSF